MKKDNQFIKVLDILEKEYGWGNMGALEKMQAELINDTIKATRMVVNKNFAKPNVNESLPHDINDFFDWLCEKGWIDGIANTSANKPNVFYEPKDLYELFRSGNDH